MIDLSGRRALVTGAASGIGAAAVGTLRELGADVAGLDVAEGEGWLHADVGDEDEAARAVAAAAGDLGGLDAVVCAAGIAGRGTVEEVEPAHFDRVLRVNLRGIYCICRAAVPHLREAGGGAIVTVASQLGIVAAPTSVAYCASKGAVISLTKAMAIDHASEGIRVNAVCPGPTETPLLTDYFSQTPDPAAERRRFESMVLAGRLGAPDEIASTIAFLVSDASSFVTGEALVVDGGYVTR